MYEKKYKLITLRKISRLEEQYGGIMLKNIVVLNMDWWEEGNVARGLKRQMAREGDVSEDGAHQCVYFMKFMKR